MPPSLCVFVVPDCDVDWQIAVDDSKELRVTSGSATKHEFRNAAVRLGKPCFVEPSAPVAVFHDVNIEIIVFLARDFAESLFHR